MKKGFTLIELLAVIIILSIIALIATPIILNVVEDAKKSAGLSETNIILDSINKYCETEDLKEDRKKCKSGLNEKDLNEILDIKKSKILEIHYDEVNDKLDWIKIESNDNIYSLKGNQMILGDYKSPDQSGANKPEILNNMIPISYDGTKWIYADINFEWYNYDKKEWANAVILSDGITKKVGDTISEPEIKLWYVWIPRFKYKLFNLNTDKTITVEPKEIEVQFEKGNKTTGTVSCVDVPNEAASTGSEVCKNAEEGNWYTHPAFTFGNQELTGFWVGKFEMSGTIDKPTIKPNETILINQTLSQFFNSIKKISENNNITGDSHLIKNMEWGAMAYLCQSKYGSLGEKKSNYYGPEFSGGGNNNDYKNNLKISTTNNLYGIFDANGSYYEIVMGNMSLRNGNFNKGKSNFEKNIESKYYDHYNNPGGQYSYLYGKLGDATKETMVSIDNGVYHGWYGNVSVTPYIQIPWFTRGGQWFSVLGYNSFDGSNSNDKSTRAVLVRGE